jgi:hypothetical protein
MSDGGVLNWDCENGHCSKCDIGCCRCDGGGPPFETTFSGHNNSGLKRIVQLLEDIRDELQTIRKGRHDGLPW